MKIEPYQRYTREWILAHDGARVACSKERYEGPAEAMADLPRVKASLKTESDKAVETIIAHLEDLADGETYTYPEKLPFFERLKCSWDFGSVIKSVWLTGYILITWGDNFWETLDIGFYKGGSYE